MMLQQMRGEVIGSVTQKTNSIEVGWKKIQHRKEIDGLQLIVNNARNVAQSRLSDGFRNPG